MFKLKGGCQCRCTVFGHIFKFSQGLVYIEGLFVGNMRQFFLFKHLSQFVYQRKKN